MGQEDPNEAMNDLYEEYAAQPALARVSEGRPLVRGHGILNAPVVVVGEAPGEQEERQGRPFVGPAGGLLQRIFSDAGVPWALCYVTNVLPWRPPGNRTPYPFEVQCSYSRLAAEVAVVDPVVVIAAGEPAWHCLTRNDMGRFADARFGWHELDGRRLLCLPHPSYLLRLKDPAERAAWERETVEAIARALTQEAPA